MKRINGRLAIWHACVECGKKRWVLIRRGKPQSSRCFPCGRIYVNRIRKVRVGQDHWRWRGGRSVTQSGYVEVWVSKDDPLAAMRNKDGCVYEHRLVIARKIGRPLASWEQVHHLNGLRGDNRPSNLRLFTKSDHSRWHKEEMVRLREEVRRLRSALRKARAS